MSKFVTKQEKCNCCGKCCTAITFGTKEMDAKFIKERAEKEFSIGEYDTDTQFITENWEQITFKEALELRRDEEFVELFGAINDSINWWKCRRLDPQTKRCTVHEIRPQVCKGFPNYTTEVLQKDFAWYSKNCGYKED